MPLTKVKVCVHYSASVHVRKAVCACGHVFGPNKSGPSAARVVVGILESDVETAAKIALEKQRNVLEDEDQFLQRKKQEWESAGVQVKRRL